MEPTELQSQADALRMLADLTELAIDAGAAMAPTWTVPETALIVGRFRSVDGSAVRALETWRQLLGEHTFSSGPAVADPATGPRTVWKVTTRLGGASVWLLAIAPSAVQATAGEAGIAVAA